MNLNELTFLRKVGRRIRERRHELRLTQAQLAERCGLHRTFLGSVERGERNVAVLNVWVIAQALRTPIWQIFHDNSQPGDSKSSSHSANEP